MQAPQARIRAVASLDEPARLALYELVRSRHPEPVGRDEAAAELGMGRPLVAFHLDRLVSAGLLETTFQRPAGKGGPGAGRPAKLYRRASQSVEISLPQREYLLAGRVMLAALAAPSLALEEVARLQGLELGAQFRSVTPPRARLLRALDEHGYEPRVAGDGSIGLRNCPFKSLVSEGKVNVCRLNHGLLTGLLEAVKASGFRASLDFEAGLCCVSLRRKQDLG